MVGFQDIIVYLIPAVVAVVIVFSIYRRLKGKDSGCNCHSCPHYGEECHCHDTQKQGWTSFLFKNIKASLQLFQEKSLVGWIICRNFA